MQLMNIDQAATACGVSAKMNRHYEQVGVFREQDRTDAGYRQYSEQHVHTLRPIRQARDLGSAIQQIGRLVGLWQDRGRPSRQVEALAEAHTQELERKAHDLLAIKATLEHLWCSAATAINGRNAPSSKTSRVATSGNRPRWNRRLGADGAGCAVGDEESPA